MPTYDYSCKSCDEKFEVVHKISEIGNNFPCPKCNSTETEKVILGVASIGDPVRLGIRKSDKGFKEVLQKIHERTAGSTMKDVIR